MFTTTLLAVATKEVHVHVELYVDSYSTNEDSFGTDQLLPVLLLLLRRLARPTTF